MLAGFPISLSEITLRIVGDEIKFGFEIDKIKIEAKIAELMDIKGERLILSDNPLCGDGLFQKFK